ncbi:hypothetical protein FQA39_LY08836 [Lamprigera yunnana]|nr:hypothetical protein FQA39_LY08836 [Lamprigera yunnana]
MDERLIETKLNLIKIKTDLLIAIRQCTQRGLYHSAKWLSEINFAIVNVKISLDSSVSENISFEEETYLLAKSYFDLKEYDRCSYFTENCEEPKTRFLYLYSQYLSIEKKKLDNMTDTNCPPDPTKNNALRQLCAVLKEDYFLNKLDGYCLYLYGIVLKKLDLNSLAMDIFVDAINAEPLHWGAWQELGLLVPDKNTLSSLRLPKHWMKNFFLAHVYLEQLNNDEALDIYYDIHSRGFEKSTYIMAQMAIAYHNRRELEKAILMFKDLIHLDPYRLDNLDTYSNLLYVKEMKTELANLAHTAVNIDKYRVETCCIIGNYYSLRSEHSKAVLYFQRALKLNPQYLSAWTLMGHEFMEMKNSNAAIQSYRQAIEVNKRDYRAWYGLGQTYEILKMPFYCIYYYKQAQQLRPNDSRMILALGETYEKLEKHENALKCYHKACNVGDVEGMALIKLAKLYDKLDEAESAAAAYMEYCLKEEDQRISGYEVETEIYNAYQYLANYHLKRGQLEEAYTHAYRCIEYNETKEQGKSLLKEIAARRGEQDAQLLKVPNQSNQNITDCTNDESLNRLLTVDYNNSSKLFTNTDKRNYMSGEEKLFLQELVNKCKTMIENKKTDCIMAAEKNKALLAFTKEFDSLSENLSRSVEQLRKCWENMKSQRKNELSEEKIERMATGGGPFKTSTNDEIEGLLDVVDIEIKDGVYSDTLQNNTREYELDDNFVLHSLVCNDEAEPQPGPSMAPARTPAQILPLEQKSSYRSRGSTIEAE